MVAHENFPRVLVVGLGRSGLAAARLAAADGAEVWVIDRRPAAGLPGGSREFAVLAREEVVPCP